MIEDLRKRCKLAKALNGVSYKDLSNYLDIRQDSFYCWLKGYYELSYSKQIKLQMLLDGLMEE